jgi:hypothetical protein
MNSYIFGIGNETKNLTKKESYTRVLVEAFNNTSILALSFSIFFFIIFAFGLYFLFKKTNFLGQTFSKVQRKRFLLLKRKKLENVEVKTSFNKNFYFEI